MLRLQDLKDSSDFQGRNCWLLNRRLKHRWLQNEFLVDVKQAVWRRAVAQYLHLVDDSLKRPLLLIILQLTGQGTLSTLARYILEVNLLRKLYVGFKESFLELGVRIALDYILPYTIVNARDPISKPVLLNSAIKGYVLVKNIRGSLLLKAPKLLLIFSYNTITPLGIDISIPENFFATFILGFKSELDYTGFVTLGPSLAFALNGTLISRGRSSANALATPPRHILPSIRLPMPVLYLLTRLPQKVLIVSASESSFSKGIYIDYRNFDTKNITPRYEFGFRLTYTTFAFLDLEIELLPSVSTSYLPPSSLVLEGGIALL
ncbi:hypothetical protein G7Y89_g11924 [Cudoniella acicularis]|uniref:beta-glucosidase n=1 Tax=Cudoniella acicularis TaxID=354080 RepID=A0A8H4RBF8_9HELO|nr:hypothetical protein G7Y89_g11924 [Cudoniella acicularis]